MKKDNKELQKNIERVVIGGLLVYLLHEAMNAICVSGLEKEDMNSMQQRLDRAVQLENYELAAKLRDKIRAKQ